MSKNEFRLDELAKLTNAKLVGSPDWIINNVSDLENADIHDASFLNNPLYTPQRYESAMRASKAGVIFVTPNTTLTEGKNYLIHNNPSQAFQIVIDELYRNKLELSGFEGIHPTAVIHETSSLGKNVRVGPHAVIDKDVQIGDNTFIGAGSYIGPGVKIGDNCVLHPHVTVREHCMIGNRVILQPGSVIGSCGFGYVNDPETKHHIKLNQVGIVIVEDDVEIGANTTIDRARFKATVIGRGTKIDNLVQIAHGVKIGPFNLIVAQTGFAGSTKTGRYNVFGGQVAVNGHIETPDGAIFAARSGITKSITKPGKYGGVPAIPLDEDNRRGVHLKLKNIEKNAAEIKSLKQRIDQFEELLDKYLPR